MEIKIIDCSRNAENGVVLDVLWQMRVTKNNNVAAHNDRIALGYKDPNSNDFVKYENLTEEKIVEWVKALYGNNVLSAIEQKLNEQLDEQNKVVRGLPF
jgi:hypothetical protein